MPPLDEALLKPIESQQEQKRAGEVDTDTDTDIIQVSSSFHLVADHAVDLDNLTVDLVLQNLDRLSKRNASRKKLDQVSSLVEQVKMNNREQMGRLYAASIP